MTRAMEDEHWKKLCQAIVEESDSNRLMELVGKLTRVLEARENKRHRQNGGQVSNEGEGG